MKFKSLFIILFFLFSCSSSNELDLDIEDLKKNGNIIYQNKQLNELKKEDFSKIKNIILKKKEDYDKNNDFLLTSSFHQLENFEFSKKIDIKKKKIFYKQKNNFYKKNIVTSNKKIIFIDDYSTLYVLDQDLQVVSKLIIYKNFDKSFPLKFSLISKDNIVYVSDNLGSIFAYEINSNTILWKNNLSVPFLSNLVFLQDFVYVSNSNGKLYSFNSANGKQNWSFETGTDVLKSSDLFKISINDNKLIFTNDLRFIYCIDLIKKKTIWSFQIPFDFSDENQKLLEVYKIIVDKDSIYLSTNSDKFYKIDISNGKIIWDIQNLKSISSIINYTTVSSVSKDGLFVILEKINGNILYKKNFFNYFHNTNLKEKIRNFNNFFVSKEDFYISSENGYIVNVSSNNLDNISLRKVSEEINSNIVTLDDAIYFIGELNSIYKIK